MSLSAQLLDAFERFWSAYPRRPENPKAPARQVFARLVKGGDSAEALIAAAGRYAAFCKASGKDPLFIPHARTWLNQRRFEDFAEDAQASASSAPEPSPEHPLDFLRPIAGEGFASWIAPLAVDLAVVPPVVTAPTAFARDTVRARWGREIEARLGLVEWRAKTSGGRP